MQLCRQHQRCRQLRTGPSSCKSAALRMTKHESAKLIRLPQEPSYAPSSSLSYSFLRFTLPALAQAKHPFTFEDMMKLKRVGDPQVSPDGKWVIFSVVDVDLAANTKTPHIWIVRRIRTGSAVRTQEDHRRSGRRPSALGPGWQALRVPLDERRWLAGLDRGLRRSQRAR